ncbi:MAG: recombinase family protein, partial [Bacteroidota bacterium]
MNINPPDLKYFLYARKSSESEDRQSKSIEDQVTEMTAFAQSKGLQIVEVFTESKSAKTPFQRPVFTEMVKRIKLGEAQGLLTWKLNRLARNPIEGGEISWMLQQQIIKHLQTYGSQHWPHDNVLMLQFEFGMANQYSRDLSEVVKRGMRQKAERGWYPTSNLPAGYKVNRERSPSGNEPEIISDPEQFMLVKQVWEKFLTGRYSISTITAYGQRIGVKNRSGKPLCRSNFHRLLTNKFYCGYFTWKDEQGQDKLYQGKHRQMISEAEFDDVQQILQNRKTVAIPPKRDNPFPFKGRITCGECSAMITAEHKLQAICTNCKYKFSSKYKDHCPSCKTRLEEMINPSIIDKTYYHCTRGKGKCSQKYIEAKQLERQVLHLIESITIPSQFATWAKASLKTQHDFEMEMVRGILDSLRTKEKRILDRLEHLLTLRSDNEISREQFKSKQVSSEKELLKIRAELARTHSKVNSWIQVAGGYIDLAEKANEILEKGSLEDLN